MAAAIDEAELAITFSPHFELLTRSKIQPSVFCIIGTPAAKLSNILFGDEVPKTGKSLNKTNEALEILYHSTNSFFGINPVKYI